MPLPPDWKFSFQAVLKRYEQVVVQIHCNGPYSGMNFEGETFKHYVESACSFFKFDESARRCFECCITAFYGQRLTDVNMKEMAWRLAAGHDRFKGGLNVYNAFQKEEEHWVPLRIEQVSFAPPSRAGKVQLALRLRALDGVFAGLVFSQRITFVFATKVIAKDLGFPRFEGMDHNELSQCHFVGSLLVENPQYPGIVEFAPTASSVAHNRRLRKARNEPCLRGFSFECHRCPIGYEGEDPCIRGTHRASFVKKDCPACKVEAYFDPASDSQICVSCVKKKHLEQLKLAKQIGG